MSLRQTSPVRQTSFLGRSVLPVGDGGVAAGIPADVRDDLQIEPGEKVDLIYDRDEPCLKLYFNREATALGLDPKELLEDVDVDELDERIVSLLEDLLSVDDLSSLER